MNPPNGSLDQSTEPPSPKHEATTVLVAVESARVREALVAMLGALDGFRVVAEAATDEAALQAARAERPHLALIEPELSGCGGWWVIQQIEAEHLAAVVVALGRRADGILAQMVGAQTYVQMGTAPRELLSALEAAMSLRAPAASSGSNGSAGTNSSNHTNGSNGSAAQAELDLLSDPHSVL